MDTSIDFVCIFEDEEEPNADASKFGKSIEFGSYGNAIMDAHFMEAYCTDALKQCENSDVSNKADSLSADEAHINVKISVFPLQGLNMVSRMENDFTDPVKSMYTGPVFRTSFCRNWKSLFVL